MNEKKKITQWKENVENIFFIQVFYREYNEIII